MPSQIGDGAQKVVDNTSNESILKLINELYDAPTPEDFLDVFEKHRNQITPDTLLYQVTDGPRRGISLLWLLAAFAVKGVAGPLVEALEEFENQAPRRGVLEGIRAKISALFFTPENKPQRQLLLSDVLVKAVEGTFKGQSIFQLLARAADKGHVESFLKVWMKFQNEISLQEVVATVEEENKGRSALWFLCGTAYKNPAPFLSVWEKFENVISVKDILFKPENEIHKGKSMLWVLAGAVMAGHPEPFLKVWAKFQDEITLEDIVEQAEEAEQKVESTLLVLAWAAHEGNIEPFLKVFEKFKDKLSLKDLQVRSEKGPNKGKSVLWVLALTAAKSNPEPFLKIWENFQNEITLKDLTLQVEEGKDKGRSLIWILAVALYVGSSKPFIKVLEKFQNEITIADLLVDTAQEKGKVALLLLVSAMGNNGNLKLITTILQTIPGEIPHASLMNASPKLSLEKILTRLKLMPLVLARNAFFLQISQMKSQEFSAENVQALFTAAEMAEKSGYLNAFYDVAQYLSSVKKSAHALEAYKKISKKSSYFHKKSELVCEQYFVLASQENITEDAKKDYLTEALISALPIQNNMKEELIQKIASIYIYGKEMAGNPHVIPDGFLEKMNETTPLEWCFERFDEIKKSIALAEINPSVEQDMSILSTSPALTFTEQSLHNSTVLIAPETGVFQNTRSRKKAHS